MVSVKSLHRNVDNLIKHDDIKTASGLLDGECLNLEPCEKSNNLHSSLDLLNIYETIYFHCDTGILITNEELLSIKANMSYYDITGFNENEIIGKKCSLLWDVQKDEEKYKSIIDEIHLNSIWKGETELIKGSGCASITIDLTVFVTYKAGRISNYVFVLSDVSEKRKAEKHFQYLAYYDSLTSLMNRNMIQESINMAIKTAKENAQKLAIIFLDIDDFKEINDTHGHNVGDLVLKAFAKQLKRSLRSDDIIGRLGGDEFIIAIRRQKDIDNIEFIVSKLLKKLNNPINIQKQSFTVTSSVGISIFPDNGKNFDNLIQHADRALYKAKGIGKATWTFC